METNEAKTTCDAYGGKINVKYIYLGSIFRQFVLSRTNVNYFHYVWRMCCILTGLTFIVLLLQKYFENIPRIGVAILVVSFIVAAAVHCVMTEIVEESVDVIDGLGIQLSSRGRFGKENKTFFEFNAIKNIIINEAVTMQRVLFYLALTVNTKHNKEVNKDQNMKEDETKMIVLFKHTMPRLEELQNIYNEIEPFLNNHNKKGK